MIARVPYLAGGGYLELDFRKGFQPDQQIFSHIDDDGIHRHFDIPKLYRIAHANPEMFPVLTNVIDPELAERLKQIHGIEIQHLKTITAQRANEPGLILQFDDHSFLILDGNHRFVKRTAMGCTTMDFYVFDETEVKPAMLAIPSYLTTALIRR